MAKYKEPQSETEKPTRTHKSRTTVAAHAQAQQEYLLKHINSNGPKDKPKIDPMDFNEYPIKVLNDYSQYYNLGLRGQSVKSEVLYSEIGKKSLSYKKTLSKIGKLDKIELSNSVKKHFVNIPVKENEIIANFLYKVKNEDKEFKLSFK